MHFCRSMEKTFSSPSDLLTNCRSDYDGEKGKHQVLINCWKFWSKSFEDWHDWNPLINIISTSWFVRETSEKTRKKGKEEKGELIIWIGSRKTFKICQANTIKRLEQLSRIKKYTSTHSNASRLLFLTFCLLFAAWMKAKKKDLH